MAVAKWRCWPLPAWLGSGAAWFLVLNVVVGAIFTLWSRRGGSGITRRASSSSVVLQRLLSFSIFSFPSSCFHTPEPEAGATFQETEETGTTARRSPSTGGGAVAPPVVAEPITPAEEEGEEDESSMSMDEAYAFVLEGRQRPPLKEEEATRLEVDAKAEDFIRGFKEDLRQQRLKSIFNYTQMLKRRAASRPPVAAPDTNR